MLINLSDVLTTEGESLSREIPLEADYADNGRERYAIAEKSPLSLTVTHIGEGKAQAQGKCRIVLDAVCDRCLAPVTVPMELTIDCVLRAPGAAAEEEEDGTSAMDGWELDTEALVRDEMIVDWPVKILCREDCRGVCPVCGQNRNERECGCDAFVPDPRMAAINTIFHWNKEV